VLKGVSTHSWDRLVCCRISQTGDVTCLYEVYTIIIRCPTRKSLTEPDTARVLMEHKHIIENPCGLQDEQCAYKCSSRAWEQLYWSSSLSMNTYTET